MLWYMFHYIYMCIYINSLYNVILIIIPENYCHHFKYLEEELRSDIQVAY